MRFLQKTSKFFFSETPTPKSPIKKIIDQLGIRQRIQDDIKNSSMDIKYFYDRREKASKEKMQKIQEEQVQQLLNKRILK